MKKVIYLSLIVSIFFAGCAGNETNPIAMDIPGDENPNYQSPPMETSQIQQKRDVLRPKIDKFVTNAAWAAAGAFFPIPILLDEFERSQQK